MVQYGAGAGGVVHAFSLFPVKGQTVRPVSNESCVDLLRQGTSA